jgi:hypothetical protein
LETIHVHRHHDVRAPADEPPLPPLGRALNVLLVWPRFSASFWSLSGIMELLPRSAHTRPSG